MMESVLKRVRVPRAVILAGVAVVVVAVIVVVGRAILPAMGIALPIMGQSSQSADEPPSGQVVPGLTVVGRPGATPVVTVAHPIEVDGVKAKVVSVGQGRTITEGAPVLLAVTAFDGANGQILSPGGRPQLTVGLADSEQIGGDLTKAVIGHPEGTRIVHVREVVEGARAQGATSSTEIDVIDILPSVANGEPPQSGLMQPQSGVSTPAPVEVQSGEDLAEMGQSEADVDGESQAQSGGQTAAEEFGPQSGFYAAPSTVGPLQVMIGGEGPVIRHGKTVPAEVTVQTLLEGNGGQVGATDELVVQYIVTGWKDGRVRSSTWRTGLPELLSLPGAMPGLRTALVDHRVGSRLAITIPPDQATGDDTLCLVVDILGTQPSSVDTAVSGAQSGRPAVPASPAPAPAPDTQSGAGEQRAPLDASQSAQ